MNISKQQIVFSAFILLVVCVAIPVLIVPQNVYAANCQETSKSYDGTIITLQKVTLPGGIQGCQGTNNLMYVYNSDGVLVGYDGANKNIPFTENPDEVGLYNKKPGPITCNSMSDFWGQPTVCLARSISAIIGAALITVTAWLLEIVGLLFNYLLYYTVIAFGDATNGFLTQGVLDGINATWTVFRDIANILIIGLFTFIAISTILGNHEFGAKKMLAKALIIAVLINFSLLFTKMIIDVSNFTAYQFYNAASGLGSSGTGLQRTNQGAVTDTSALSFTQDGIAGQFIKYLGVTSFTDVFAKFKAGADDANGYGLASLLHGLFGATMLLATAAVLLYGSFLLVSRAILIVFLLITSSLAFAAYLLPKSIQSSYGWSTWWDSLVKTAVFAPLLMMFLWATLQLASNLNRGGEGTLGKLMTDPTNAGNLSALFGYIIILGLLFASFKISSSFATKIAGFNFAAMIPAIGLAAGARVAAFAGRQTIGRASMAVSERLKTASGNEQSSMFARRLADFGSQRFKTLAKQDFNAMHGLAGTAIGGVAGMKADTLAGKKVGGYEGSEEAKAHRIAEQARRMAPSAATQAKLVTQAVEAELKNDPDLARQHAQAKTSNTAAKDDHETEKENLTALRDQHAQEMKALHAALEEARGSGEAGAAASAQERIGTARRAHAQAIEEQTERIKHAQGVVDRTQHLVDRATGEATTRAVGRGALHLDSDGKVTFQKASELAGALVASGFTSALFSKEENARLARMAGHEVGVQERKKKVKEADLAAALAGLTGEEHHETPHTPTPAAHAPAPATPATPAPAHTPTPGGAPPAH